MSSEVRTYRVVTRGEFQNLSDDQRTKLRDELDQHDLLLAAYTETGTLSYDAELRPFTIRCLVVQPAGRADQEAADTGALVALELLDAAGLDHHRLRTTASCLEDVKINRRGK
ncbi:DUF6204 family protein [Kribbella sp. NPDC051770]|uniref:DUF6204 family protein n=1 Tax=Kribbella sp. NPDC051770 TaxID=3155413 RepID=UPI003413EFAA